MTLELQFWFLLWCTGLFTGHWILKRVENTCLQCSQLDGETRDTATDKTEKKTILSLDRSDNSMVFHGISMVYAMYLGNYSKWLKAGGTVFPLAVEFPRWVWDSSAGFLCRRKQAIAGCCQRLWSNCLFHMPFRRALRLQAMWVTEPLSRNCEHCELVAVEVKQIALVVLTDWYAMW